MFPLTSRSHHNYWTDPSSPVEITDSCPTLKSESMNGTTMTIRNSFVLCTTIIASAIVTSPPTSAATLFAPPITLQTGDQATGTLANFTPISATPTPGDYGSLDLYFAHAPLDGDILEIQLFADNPDANPLGGYTWQIGITSPPWLAVFPFGHLPLGPGAAGMMSQYGGRYTLTMLAGEADISRVSASILYTDTTIYSTTDVPVSTPEPQYIASLAILALLTLRRPSNVGLLR